MVTGNRQCDDCACAASTIAAAEPPERGMLAVVPISIAIGGIVTWALIAQAWQWFLFGGIGYGMLALLVAVLGVGVAVVSFVGLLRAVYVFVNVVIIGTPVFYVIETHDRHPFHVHLRGNKMTSETVLYVKGRVGGIFRGTQLNFLQGSVDASLQLHTWDGEMMTMRTKDGMVVRDRIPVVMELVRRRISLRDLLDPSYAKRWL